MIQLFNYILNIPKRLRLIEEHKQQCDRLESIARDIKADGFKCNDMKALWITQRKVIEKIEHSIYSLS